MRSGRLKDRVTIQSYTVTKDAIGGEVQAWTDYLTRNCAIEPRIGKEFTAAQGESTELAVPVRFRYEKNLLNTKKRLVDRRVSPEVIYDIQAVIDVKNRHVELIAECVVRDAPG